MAPPPAKPSFAGPILVLAGVYWLLLWAQAESPLVGPSALRQAEAARWLDAESLLRRLVAGQLGDAPLWIYLAQGAASLLGLVLLFSLLGYHRSAAREQVGLKTLLAGLYLYAPLSLQGALALGPKGHLSGPLLLALYLSLWVWDRRGQHWALGLVVLLCGLCLWADPLATGLLWLALLVAQLITGVPSRLMGALWALVGLVMVLIGAVHSFGGPGGWQVLLGWAEQPRFSAWWAPVFWFSPLFPMLWGLLAWRGGGEVGRRSRAYWAPLLFVTFMWALAPWLAADEVPLRLLPMWPFLLLLVGLVLAGKSRPFEAWEFFLWWIGAGVLFLLQRDPLRPYSTWLRGGETEALVYAMVPALGAALLLWLAYFWVVRNRHGSGPERALRVLALIALAWLVAAPWRAWAPYNRADHYGLKGQDRARHQARRLEPTGRSLHFPDLNRDPRAHCPEPEGFDYLLLAKPLLQRGTYCFSEKTARLTHEPVKKLGDYWLWRRRGLAEALEE